LEILARTSPRTHGDARFEVLNVANAPKFGGAGVTSTWRPSAASRPSKSSRADLAVDVPLPLLRRYQCIGYTRLGFAGF
jgi:hypothetical protein